MMSITEDYVSYEVAKLLKEKGFEIDTNNDYWKIGEDSTMYFMSSIGVYSSNPNDVYAIYRPENSYPCPTLQMAMKWIRDTHHIYIVIEPHALTNGIACSYECLYWYKGKYYYPYPSEKHELHGKVWNTYEDALNEIIKYILNMYI